MSTACSKKGEKRNVYRLLVGMPRGNRPLGRLRRWWVDNIKMNPGKIGWGGMHCIVLAHYRDQWRAVVKTVMNLRVP
jgi:hypothetical protein